MDLTLKSFAQRVYHHTTRRCCWWLLLTAALLPFFLALVFQHSRGLPPCVLCIYQRVALLGIALSALLVLCAPTCRFLRGAGILLWLYSAARGLLVAWEQTQRYLHPLHFNSCEFRVRFPTQLPLDAWFPRLFRADAACEGVGWSWLGLPMPQWMVVLFTIQVLVSLLLLTSQYYGWKQPVADRCRLQ